MTAKTLIKIQLCRETSMAIIPLKRCHLVENMHLIKICIHASKKHTPIYFAVLSIFLPLFRIISKIKTCRRVVMKQESRVFTPLTTLTKPILIRRLRHISWFRRVGGPVKRPGTMIIITEDDNTDTYQCCCIQNILL